MPRFIPALCLLGAALAGVHCASDTTTVRCAGANCAEPDTGDATASDASERDAGPGEDTNRDGGGAMDAGPGDTPTPDVAPDAPPDAGPCGMPEVCNGLDDDCDGLVDEGETDRCDDACCDDGVVCEPPYGCIPDLGPCTSNDDCWSDSYCVEGLCLPYGLVDDTDRDDTCQRDIVIDAFEPAVQCAWTAATDGVDPDAVHAMSTPMVADLGLDGDPDTRRPSIVFASFPTTGSYSEPGTLRIIDGATCEPQISIADVIAAPASPAIGDITGDGRADIVAQRAGGGLIAFAFAPDGSLRTLWHSATCVGDARTPDATANNRWSGPSLHDLDDDGVPEILFGGLVYTADGCLRSTDASFDGYSVGTIDVVADVDEDGTPEIVLANGIFEWDPISGQRVAEPWFDGTGLPAGQTAVADMGLWPTEALRGADGVEFVVVSSGSARVHTLDGELVFSAAIPGGGTGGPPTIADFDGDGRAEFATAGGSRYVVFDLDCEAAGTPAGCEGPGILWSQPSQDRSSNVTGSSVFDFDADGAAEAVYADECFLRVYEGATGRVVYSASRSSGTTYENPVIADVDGDFRSEIVSSVNDYTNVRCPATDPLFASATYARSHGIVVLRDAEDRWAASRPIWNQHAYAITHVLDDGTIPRSSDVRMNWRIEGLNNFRQNVQGDLSALGIPDLTAAEGGDPREVDCEPAGFGVLEARICNRGLLPMGPGMVVAFADGAIDGPELCRAEHPAALPIGTCAEVACTAELGGDDVDVFVVIDPDDAIEECWEGNNFAFFGQVRCKG